MSKKGRVTGNRKAGRRYADGRPFDDVQYLQAKILLKPDRFTSAEALQRFGKLAGRTARALGLDLIDESGSHRSPQVREIIFVDTPDFRLYKSGFILRRRVSYVDGFPAGDPEIVFKFRHADAERAAALDVRPQIKGKYRIKLKMNALPLNGRLGGYRFLFSHGCQFGLSQTRETDRTLMSTLTRVFPPLAAVKKSDAERVLLVNEGIVEELLVPLDRIDFGRGAVAKSNVALWRTRAEHTPLVGEYSFQLKFDRTEDVPNKFKKRVRSFFVTLQHDLADWITVSTTKVALVYGLKGHGLAERE